MSAVFATNPFVGLRPYEAAENLLFFGRQQQVAELLRRLNDVRFVAVVGSSGCGKSSLVRAGLIPVLQAGFLVAERDIWYLATMKPGDAPLAHLAACLIEAIGAAGATLPPPQAEVQALALEIEARGAEGALAALSSAMAGDDANLLLLVDQFEELFRFGRGAVPASHRDAAADFVSILIDLATQRELPVYVVITMRSDFLGDCDAFPGLPEALNRGQYLVPRLTRAQRRDAIEGPIRLYRQDIAARLTDRLLNETIDTRDDLPVLQHALMRTWDDWQPKSAGPVDVTNYEDIGTVTQALSWDADAALEGMSARELLLTKRLLQALTTVDAANRWIRRPAKLFDIAARSEASPAEVWAIVERFRSAGRSFLVVSNEQADANPMIDISHESLIRQWKVLGRWVDEEVESIKVYRRLAETARLHRAGRSRLYVDPDLQVALDWQAAESPNAAWAIGGADDFEAAMAFLRQSRNERDRGLAEAEFERRWNLIRIGIAVFVLALFFFHLGLAPIQQFWAASTKVFTDIAASATSGNDATPEQAARWLQIANALADMVRFAAHAVLYLLLTGVAKQAYRRASFKAIRDATLAEQKPGPPSRQSFAMILRNIKARAPGVVEAAAKWICIVAGAAILTTCSYAGFSNGSLSGVAMSLIGLGAAAALVGWVFAVARLNSEVKAIGARLDAESAAVVPPQDQVAAATPREAG